jgi:hypothetical protein
MECGRGKEGRKDRENEFAVEKDFRGMLNNLFVILHGALVSHILQHRRNTMFEEVINR